MNRLLAAIALCAATHLQASAADNDALRALAGAKIIAGFFGVDRSDPRFRAIVDNLEQGRIAGVLFLRRNITDRSALEAMLHDLRHCRCPARPLIAIDEEGGAIQRLGRIAAPDIPSAAAVGAMPRSRASKTYAQLAQKLARLGFNVNLAPVVDLDRNPDSPAIGKLGRSYGRDSRKVSAYAAIFVEQHRKQGIVTVLKHFPGHGSAGADSHDAVADVAATWSADELKPYRQLIATAQVDGIMVGHVANRTTWGGPATQDGANAITQMLRRDLNYKGVVVSDDLSMRAITAERPLADAVKSAVRAGIDIVIVTRLRDDDETADVGAIAHAAILAGLNSGEIDRRSLEESAGRIEQLRRRLAPTPADGSGGR